VLRRGLTDIRQGKCFGDVGMIAFEAFRDRGGTIASCA
jgi:hypothetical protein